MRFLYRLPTIAYALSVEFARNFLPTAKVSMLKKNMNARGKSEMMLLSILYCTMRRTSFMAIIQMVRKRQLGIRSESEEKRRGGVGGGNRTRSKKARRKMII